MSKLKSEFDHWKRSNNQHGRQAFSRFVMLKFLDELQDMSDDFIFKGGNLLWHYIKTPRETIDLDLSTLKLSSHIEVKNELESSFKRHLEIEFHIKEFKEVNEDHEIGAAITVEYKTVNGQKNQFKVDIVYALPTDISKTTSTLNGKQIKSASIENIISDKLDAAHRFKSGNTRMKDFDDLWRISKSDISINYKKLKDLLDERKIPSALNLDWIKSLEKSWKRHSSSYKDIPKKLTDVFNEVNDWLAKNLK